MEKKSRVSYEHLGQWRYERRGERENKAERNERLEISTDPVFISFFHRTSQKKKKNMAATVPPQQVTAAQKLAQVNEQTWLTMGAYASIWNVVKILTYCQQMHDR